VGRFAIFTIDARASFNKLLPISTPSLDIPSSQFHRQPPFPHGTSSKWNPVRLNCVTEKVSFGFRLLRRDRFSPQIERDAVKEVSYQLVGMVMGNSVQNGSGSDRILAQPGMSRKKRGRLTSIDLASVATARGSVPLHSGRSIGAQATKSSANPSSIIIQ